MTQPVNPWLQFIGPKGQTAQNQWLQKLSDIYNNPQLRFAVDRAGNLINKTQSDEEESDVEKLGQTGNNVLDTVRQLQQTSSTVPQTAAQFNTMGAKEAFDIINNARQTGANSVNTVKNLAQSSQQTFKNIGQTIKQINNVGPRSSIPQIGKPINSAVKTAGKAGAKGAHAASNAASIAGGAAGLALTAGSHIFDIVKSNKSKLKNTIEPYQKVNSWDDLNNFRIHSTKAKLSQPSLTSSLADIGLKASEGALAGSALGPWGTLGGAIGGTAAGIANSVTKAFRYKKDLRNLVSLNKEADIAGNNLFFNYGDELSSKDNRMNLQNYSKINSTKLAEGGQIENVFNNGGTHESNPYGGIFQGQDQVEEGEVRIGDFIFSARVNADRDILSKFNCAVKRENATYADIAKQILDNFNERNDYISNKTKRVLFERLAQAQEYQKVSEEAAKYGMTPEEYTQYQQQLQEQQAAQQQYQQEEAPVDEQQMMMQQPFYEDVEPQQYAFGGRMFANGGNRTEPGKPPYTGNLYEKPKSNWQKLQERLEEQFPELQKHRRDIYDFVKSHLSGIGGDMELAYELTYGGLNDLLFGTSGTNEEFQNAIFAAMPFVGKIKGLGNASKNIVKGIPTKATGQAISHNKAIEKEASIINEMVDKKIASRKANAGKLDDVLSNMYNDYLKKHPLSPLTKQGFFQRYKPEILKTLGFAAVASGVDAGFEIYDWTETSKDRDDAAQNAIRNSINETYGYNNVPTSVAVPNTNSVNTNVYNPPLLFEDPLQTTNNLPQYVAAPDESTAYNPNATLNTNSPTTTKTNPPYRYTENVYGNAYNPSSGNSTRNNYSFPYNVKYNEPGLEDFVARRGDNDTINAFTAAYNKATGKKYTPAQIVKNLSDHKWKDIHEAFYKFIQPNEGVAAEPNNLNDTPNQDSDVASEQGVDYNDDLKQYYYPIANVGEDDEESDETNDDWKTGLYDAARMIPTLGKLRGIFEQEEPDEAYANEILSYYRPTDYNPTGRYKTYSSADQYMLARQARAQRNALAQQYLANAGGNPAMANYMLAVNDAQYNQDLADNYLKIKQYNDQLRDQALEYNNQLDEANEVRRANTQQANNQLWANLGLPAAAAREQERRDVEEAKYANQESFWNDLATIARERQDRELIRRNPALFYDAWMNYKG